MTRSLILTALLIPAAFAQGQLECSQIRYCEMREETVSSTGRLEINDLRNGSIRVHGSNRRDVVVRMRVEADANSEAEAKDLLGRVRTAVTPGRVSVDGPEETGPFAWMRGLAWSVSVEVLVPRGTELVLDTRNGAIHADGIDKNVRASTRNGSIRLQDVTGNVEFDSRNGSVHLLRAHGSVRGESRNGEIEVDLAGNTFEGRSLDVETRNGSVTIGVPRAFNAAVTTETLHGALHSDFLMTVSGWIGRRTKEERKQFNIGSGGSPITISTRNGGIRLRRL